METPDMLVITLRNDGTGPDSSSNYEYRVYVNMQEISHGTVKGHNRKDGWEQLVKMLSEKAIEKRNS